MEWEYKNGKYFLVLPANYTAVVQHTTLGNWQWLIATEEGRTVITGLESMNDYAKEVAKALGLAYLEVKAKQARLEMIASAALAQMLG